MKTFYAVFYIFTTAFVTSLAASSQSPESWRTSSDAAVIVPTNDPMTDEENLDSQRYQAGALIAEVRLSPVFDPIPARYDIHLPGLMRGSLLVEIIIKNSGSKASQVPTRIPNGLPWIGWKDDGTFKIVYEFFPAIDPRTNEVLQLPESDYGPVTLAPGESTKLAPVIVPHAALLGKKVVIVVVAIEKALQQKTGWPEPIEIRVENSKALKAIQADLEKYPEK